MRLIDANALEKAINEWMPKNQEELMASSIPPIENLAVSILMTIDEQPTIDAIPIEWIMRYSFDGKRKHPISITEMIADWRKEHAETD